MNNQILIVIYKFLSLLIPIRKLRHTFRDRLMRPLKWKLPNNSFSQEGEDLILNRYFKGVKKGIYVDIGAHHPFRFSNTALLYKKGWHGINVDATPGVKKLFDQCRVRDINIEALVSNKSGSNTFYMFDEPAVNTCDSNGVEDLIDNGYKLINKLDIPSMSLKQILDTNISKKQVINFLSIDVEGYGYDVLASNDWSVYRPQVIAIEVLKTDSINEALSKDESIFLQNNGYVLFSKTINTLFFHEEKKQ